METKLFSESEINKAANFLIEDKLVAFPTETVYGLGANALSENAIKKIFLAKGRPSDNPLIIHIAKKEQLNNLVYKIPKIAEKLMQEFWPGPLTLVFEKSNKVPKLITAGLNTVAIRMPAHKIALKLIKKANIPIAAPSANSSTKPSPTLAEHVIEDLDGKIEGIIDGGKVEVGIESTVLDLTDSIPTILRPGKVTKEDLEKVIGKVRTKTGSGKETKSPGMKYKHYSPNAKVLLAPIKEFEKLKQKYKNKKIGEIKLSSNLEDYAKNIFSSFRKMDKENVEIILVESVDEKGLGVGIMNRLKKAA